MCAFFPLIHEEQASTHNPVSIGEAVFATAHVAVGALLLWATLAAALFARRIVTTRRQSSVASGTLEGAR